MRVAEAPAGKVFAMNQTTYDRGMEKGLEKGLERGLRETILRQGRKRFGAPSPELEIRLRTIQNVSLLEHLTDRILETQSWDDLLSEISG